MSEPSQASAFEVQDALSAFNQFADEENLRLKQTDPSFDKGLHQRAQKLVSERLTERLNGQSGQSGKPENEQ